VLPALKVCTAYKLDRKVINYFPANIDVLARCEPVYEELPGWMTSTENIRKYKDLPVNAKNYVKRMEDFRLPRQPYRRGSGPRTRLSKNPDYLRLPQIK